MHDGIERFLCLSGSCPLTAGHVTTSTSADRQKVSCDGRLSVASNQSTVAVCVISWFGGVSPLQSPSLNKNDRSSSCFLPVEYCITLLLYRLYVSKVHSQMPAVWLSIAMRCVLYCTELMGNVTSFTEKYIHNTGLKFGSLRARPVGLDF